MHINLQNIFYALQRETKLASKPNNNSKQKKIQQCINFVARSIKPMTNITPKKFTIYTALLCLVFSPNNALAIQVHSAPEGLYVHQMAHLLYIAALTHLLLNIKTAPFKDKGWYFVKIFAILMILWNITAAFGHTIALFLGRDVFFSHNGYLTTQMVPPHTTTKMLYFFTSMDHLLCVPALLFLMLGIRSFYNKTLKEDKI